MDKIGIKLANGEFYPILDAESPAKKQLTVTTVTDGQKSVQIDLYRGEGESVLNGDYVGSLVVESIGEAPAGEPDIRLELELDEAGMLKCSVRSPDTGEIQSLRVSLESLGEEKKYEIPDFDLEDERTDSLPSEATSPEEGAGLLAAAATIREERERRKSPLVFVAILVGILAAVFLGWLIYQFTLPGAEKAADKAAGGSLATTAAAPVPAKAAAPVPAAKPESASPVATAPAAAPVAKPAPPVTATAPAAPKPAAAVAAPPAVTTAKAKEQRYRLKWGDTLWDLAFVYYRDPWLYPRIAKANKIKNPNRILAGAWIVIPPR